MLLRHLCQPRLIILALAIALPHLAAAETKVFNGKVSNQTADAWSLILETRATKIIEGGKAKPLCWLLYQPAGSATATRLFANGDAIPIAAKAVQKYAIVLYPDVMPSGASYGTVSLRDPKGRQRYFKITLDSKGDLNLVPAKPPYLPDPEPDQVKSSSWKDPVVGLEAKTANFSLAGSYDAFWNPGDPAGPKVLFGGTIENHSKADWTFKAEQFDCPAGAADPCSMVVVSSKDSGKFKGRPLSEAGASRQLGPEENFNFSFIQVGGSAFPDGSVLTISLTDQAGCERQFDLVQNGKKYSLKPSELNGHTYLFPENVKAPDPAKDTVIPPLDASGAKIVINGDSYATVAPPPAD